MEFDTNTVSKVVVTLLLYLSSLLIILLEKNIIIFMLSNGYLYIMYLKTYPQYSTTRTLL